MHRNNKEKLIKAIKRMPKVFSYSDIKTKDLGFSIPTLQRGLKLLDDEGYIDREITFSGKGAGKKTKIIRKDV